MRSRFSAFALGLGAYLVDTLATTHPDRALPREPLERALSRARVTQRFAGLRILWSEADGDRGQVLFHAGVFVGTFANSRDHSFVELSNFVREAGAWRYASGVMATAKLFGADLSSLTPATFLARVPATALFTPRA